MRKAALALILSLSLITAGFAVPVITDTANARVHARFHAGGMGTFNRPDLNSHSDYLFICADPICIGIVGWAIGRILDSVANTPCSKVPAGGCDYHPNGPTGGGGGGTF